MSRLAIMAGAGQLPVSIASAFPDAFVVAFSGMETSVQPDVTFRFEHLGGLFETLREESVERVVMAGAMSRPPLDPSAFDDGMAAIAPILLEAMSGGDDGLLRQVISIFEDQDFRVIGAHSLLPELTAEEGILVGDPISSATEQDIVRADSILGSLSPVDVGQAVVVERGVCLGVETIQGTDALLDFVAQTPQHLRRGAGVLVKRPKVAQDLRVDMPTIGPDTIAKVKEAGLSGVIVSPGTVLLVERDALIAKARQEGVFVLARRHG